MAQGLAEAGASIVICARNLAKCEEAAQELGTLGIKALALQCDVTVPEDVDHVVVSTVSEFGRIDILVNNAGGAGERAAPEDTSLDDWNRVLNTDLTSLLICIKAVGPEMIRRKSGKIINITSVFGRAGTDIVDDIAYHAAKAGAENFTRALALKWAKHNINVNGIAPGFFPTPMAKELLDDVGGEIAKVTPLGRLGRGSDLKGVVVFLASPASDFVTGEILCVDGGWMIRGSGIYRAVVS
jgi:gluconate 5-dehydrogenase